jgi:lyso-ornithine lipid O-acyltransferase
MARIKLVLVLMAFAAGTLVLASGQFIALRTGLFNEFTMPRLWHRMILRLVGLRVSVRGAPSPRWPLLIAANHISWTDIMAIGSVMDVHFIARGDMAQWPVMGTLARLQRVIFVRRDQRRTSSAQAGEIAERLDEGGALVLFAEGTTGDGNIVLPFKSTLFAAASLAGANGIGRAVTVQPVAIAYTMAHGVPLGRLERTRLAWMGDQSLLPHLEHLLSGGAVEVVISFAEPVEAGPDIDRKTLARMVEARVRTAMAEALHRPPTHN